MRSQSELNFGKNTNEYRLKMKIIQLLFICRTEIERHNVCERQYIDLNRDDLKNISKVIVNQKKIRLIRFHLQ